METVSSGLFQTSSRYAPVLAPCCVASHLPVFGIDCVVALRPLCKVCNWMVESEALPNAKGSEKEHSRIREEVVQYMESHHDDFAPFVEDDEGFEKYMKRMRKVCPLTGLALCHTATIVVRTRAVACGSFSI